MEHNFQKEICWFDSSSNSWTQYKHDAWVSIDTQESKPKDWCPYSILCNKSLLACDESLAMSSTRSVGRAVKIWSRIPGAYSCPALQLPKSACRPQAPSPHVQAEMWCTPSIEPSICPSLNDLVMWDNCEISDAATAAFENVLSWALWSSSKSSTS